MNSLPRKSEERPPSITLEKPASQLASLTITKTLEQLASTVVAQWRDRDAFRDVQQFGIGPVRQLLFYGPPGNGKTVACQWLASQIDVPLYRVRSEQLVEGLLGATTTNVADLMMWISRQPAAIVLFDEVESLFPSRLGGGSSDACRREIAGAMTVFWQFLDRWESPHLFCLATNLLDRLDPALVSRIELQLEFGPPTPEQARDVLTYWSERFHGYDADKWAPQIAELQPESFRELWQWISAAVRDVIVSRTK